MKKGDIVKGPAFIRAKYKGEWEYNFLYPNGDVSPFGWTPPSAVKWVYQVTWLMGLQRIHRIKPQDVDRGYDGPESNCWWMKRRGAADLKGFEEAWKVHTHELTQPI